MNATTLGAGAAVTRTGSADARLAPAAVLRHVAAVTRRNLVRLRNDPGQLVEATVMPMALALVFVYVFGGAIGDGHASYRQYLIPGIMVETVSFASRSTGIGMNLDFHNGVMDRFRSLPIARSAVLSGRIVADLCRMFLGQAVMLGFAFLIGFRIHTGVLPALAALGMILLFGVAMCWVSAVIGLSVRSPQTVQGVGFMWLMPLQFGSSMFVPTDTMPGWLRTFAEANPISSVIDTCRALLIGGPVAPHLWAALAWTVGTIAIFAPIAVRLFFRRT